MKFNAVPSAIAVGLACLIAYAFYAFGGDSRNAVAVCALLFTCMTLLCTIGIDFGSSRSTTVIRTVAGTTFLLGLGALVLLARFSNSIPVLVIIMGIMSLLFMLISYGLTRSGV